MKKILGILGIVLLSGLFLFGCVNQQTTHGSQAIFVKVDGVTSLDNSVINPYRCVREYSRIFGRDPISCEIIGVSENWVNPQMRSINLACKCAF